jgi:hypothetical protein
VWSAQCEDSASATKFLLRLFTPLLLFLYFSFFLTEVADFRSVFDNKDVKLKQGILFMSGIDFASGHRDYLTHFQSVVLSKNCMTNEHRNTWIIQKPHDK